MTPTLNGNRWDDTWTKLESNFMTTMLQTNFSKMFQTLLAQKNEPGWLTALRREAMESFELIGLPTQEEEDWRYTNVQPIFSQEYQPESARTQDPIDMNRLELGNYQWHRLVFVNGNFSKELSSLENMPKGVVIQSLAQALQEGAPALEAQIKKSTPAQMNAFGALNLALFQDGAFIHIPEKTKVEIPLHVLFVSHRCGSAHEPVMANVKNIILAGAGSAATIVTSFLSLEDFLYFNNVSTDVFLAPGASVDFYDDQKESIQAFHMASAKVHLEKDARFHSTSVALGASISRNDLHLDLDAEGAVCDLKGIYFATGYQHVDNHLFIDHKKPRGTSKQLYKGILDGHASGAFSGKILIREGAQQTDAEQVNKNLLLSDFAKADTKPQLEIFADDVKATHGAAIGQLNEEEIFYLRSRGMREDNACSLLTFGFASDLVEKITLAPIRWELDRVFWTRLQEK
ncbi:MAG: Fe-S cluster assembly protein SufD [Candidatus Omnitrophica bacterium]|nr:Fe-S cluster assembly protein SufD [Candidatus Omnitrophota bacterium]